MIRGVDREVVKAEAKKYAIVCVSAFLFAVSVNMFIVPLGLYSSGVLGISQVTRSVLISLFGSSLPHHIDIAGMINFIVNIPLFIMAFRTISKNFFFKTLLSVAAQTVFMTLIYIPAKPILDDVLANCLIGGLLGGVSMGMTLRASGCGGGLDILGVYFTKKFENFSVGKLSLMVNAGLYFICAILFDIPTAIYSIIYTACLTLAIDRTHAQNINVTCLIFSKKHNLRIQDEKMEKLHRGITHWHGYGGYTDEATDVMAVVVSKYEINRVKQIVRKNDPNAFVIFFQGTHVSGHFVKRL